MDISYRVIGLLGGGKTPQAVYKSRDKKAWLERSISEQVSRMGLEVYLSYVEEVTKDMTPNKGVVMGRPRKESAKGLADLLGLSYEEGAKIVDVVRKYTGSSK